MRFACSPIVYLLCPVMRKQVTGHLPIKDAGMMIVVKKQAVTLVLM